MGGVWQPAIISAVVSAGSAVFVLAPLTAWLSTRRERSLERAQRAADAFEELFKVIGGMRTLRGQIDDYLLAGEPIPQSLLDRSVPLFDDLNAARGKVAAVAPPAVVKLLAEIEVPNGLGLSSTTPEARVALTHVMMELRRELRVDPWRVRCRAKFSQVQTVLFADIPQIGTASSKDNKGGPA